MSGWTPAQVPNTMQLPVQLTGNADVDRYLRALHLALQRYATHVARAVQILEEHRVVTGTAAERPASTASGVLYVATDTGVLSYDGEAGWMAL